ncbi:unnamed protein product [Clonostachys rhizophaga]|uniref:Uncharacterized protein n=1 Tax=Clonostachys rhizophaga TaxID=160324 RepID=A0A9N9VG67_9HYPO|nr:unnamed protein product [Clonostachys rhizophaga]
MPTRRDPDVNDVVETKVGSVTLIVRILDIEFGNYTRTETVEVLRAPQGHDFPEVITIKRLGRQYGPSESYFVQVFY